MNLRIIKFFLEEAILSIKQNSLMAIISVMTIAISIIVLAAFFIIFFNINHTIRNVSNNLTIIAYLNQDITIIGINKVRDQITSISGITQITYRSKTNEWANLKKQLKYQTDIVNLLPKNPLPDSFVLKLTNINNIESISSELKLIDGITDIRYGKAAVRKVRKIIEIFNISGLSIVLFLFFAAFLIIMNTINLTIIAKKNEIKIMKLVGATNNFIKWSFILEGMILGVLGSVIAIGVVKVLLAIVLSKMQSSFPFLPIVSKNVNLGAVYLALLLIGFIIGTAGSYFSIRNLLKLILKN